MPFTFRIGVTGHRDFADPQAVRAAVRDAIRQVKEFLPISADRGLELTVVSALAEGADRLVAEEVLAEEGTRLEAVLPMDAGDYLDDFGQASSKQEFICLLDRASYICQVPATSSRDDSYEKAGHYVVDHSDAVIAVWDGQPARGHAGTERIVQYARRKNVALIIVRVDGAPSAEWERKPAAIVADVAKKLARYNGSRITSSEFDAELRDLRERLMPDMIADPATDPLGLSRGQVAAWLFPYFARAEILAMGRQRLFKLLSMLIFIFAAASVAAVAVVAAIAAVTGVHSKSSSDYSWIAWLEIFFLLAVICIFQVNRRFHLHDQWISYRFLAERLRSMYFLTLAGAGRGQSGTRQARRPGTSNLSEAWIERALREVMDRRPEPADTEPAVAALGYYLSQYWIESQRHYLERTSRRLARSEKWLTNGTEVLFVATLVVAGIHIFGHGFGEGTILMLAITIPAAGAAVHGFNAQRQYGPHSERYRRVAEQLELLEGTMEEAGSPDRIAECAATTERIMLQENSDWFGVMRLHDMELIT